MINLLSEETIDKIAAGEVVERPSSVVKELCENSIDAGATAVSVEIKDGGVSLIRVTDNGCGIARDEIEKAFLRHATSKIATIDDLLSISSLGFRGEALSSICAVARVEVISKIKSSYVATRYVIEGSSSKGISEVGAPDGTTFIVRDLFYNTPVRRKFLKSTNTEGSYVSEVMEHIALSHPEVAITYINGSKTVLQTSGNGDLKEVIYRIYGIEMTRELLEVADELLSGYAAKPVIARNNRGFELFFVNGRYVKSTLLSKAVEEAYSSFLMQHKFPFVVLNLTLDGAAVDANVHPTKLEVRFSDNERVYNHVREAVYNVLSERELIPSATLEDTAVREADRMYIKQEKVNEEDENELVQAEAFAKQEIKSETPINDDAVRVKREKPALPFETERIFREASDYEADKDKLDEVKQLNLFEEKILTASARDEYKIIGQVFDTYWIVQYKEKMLILDQHAAHEKVLYERFLREIKEASVISQNLMPPVVVSLTLKQSQLLIENMEYFSQTGYEIDEFGGNEYSIRAVPCNFSKIDPKELFEEILDELSENNGRKYSGELVKERIASMSCKAAVKGNNRLSVSEIEKLLDEMLTLDNPYNCPHGRPTMITMSKYELEKKFKRIV